MKKSARFYFFAFVSSVLIAVTFSGCSAIDDIASGKTSAPSPAVSSNATIHTVDPSVVSDYAGTWIYRNKTLAIDSNGNVRESHKSSSLDSVYSGQIIQLDNGTCIWNSDNDGAHNVMLDVTKSHMITVGENGASIVFDRQ